MLDLTDLTDDEFINFYNKLRAVWYSGWNYGYTSNPNKRLRGEVASQMAEDISALLKTWGVEYSPKPNGHGEVQ